MRDHSSTETRGPAPRAVALVERDADIAECFDAMHALRPQLERDTFVARMRALQVEGYRLVALRADGRVACVAGFRLVDGLSRGRQLSIDELATVPEQRRRGHAAALLDWLADHAREQGCAALQLHSSYPRHAAHRLYLQQGYVLHAHHFLLELG
jgi:GNAT superfamily N-acetyltransferase